MGFSEFTSGLLENAVNEFASLPGIGRKTAFRMVMNLLKRDPADIKRFGDTISKLHNEIRYCKSCHSISDTEICSICSDSKRDQSVICVVENIQDVMTIENTGQFNGTYHVLGGIISPVDGIGPADLKIDSLEERVRSNSVAEIILALSTTMEGDTTNFYLYKKLSRYNVLITTLARGVAIGDELEYTDEITLGRAIKNRNPYQV
ncbi:MAG TPA: recombination mediator RecR [Bacteroidales bacterium]|jgi:recombination protein RecR|nr:recombination protein RecR [Bacteroidales bacterium]HNR42300.1 recombination mediator RecR [Bacteroidales bacterium]HQG76369.1 recombination mediator RecR [Bacteroidales bacterium]